MTPQFAYLFNGHKWSRQQKPRSMLSYEPILCHADYNDKAICESGISEKWWTRLKVRCCSDSGVRNQCYEVHVLGAEKYYQFGVSLLCFFPCHHFSIHYYIFECQWGTNGGSTGIHRLPLIVESHWAPDLQNHSQCTPPTGCQTFQFIRLQM